MQVNTARLNNGKARRNAKVNWYREEVNCIITSEL
jgi:hypothetical protein